ncbi:MAG TPA: tetratricopeptide repeat protein [Pirellulales bacterium]|jgi:tetratricopeptide (TPR) repeat protein|nr:tetratricopeptide repeat protein [Pirellulales bacterium]
MATSKTDKSLEQAPPGALRARLGAVGGILKRLVAWTWRHPLQAGVILGIVMVPVLPIVVVQVTLSRRLPKAPVVAELDEAFAALDRHDYSLVNQIVHALGSDRPLTAEELKAKPFLLGVLADHDADRFLSKQQRRLRALAARHLDEARVLGFPTGREAAGMYLLGKDLYQSGQTEESVHVLEEALHHDGQQTTELNRLLYRAYLDLPEPNFHQALTYNSEYLADPALSNDQRQRALVDRCRIEFGLGDYAACRQTLDKLTPNSPGQSQAAILRAMLLEQEGRALSGEGRLAAIPAAVEKLRQAIDLLQKLPGHVTDVESSSAEVSYLLGRLAMEIGDEAGLERLRRTQLRWPTTESGFAAGFTAGQQMQSLGRTVDAVAFYRIALETTDAETEFRNRWLGLDEARESVLDAYQECLRKHDFELAIGLARACAGVFNATRSLQLEAQAEGQWGRHLLATATDPSSPKTQQRVFQGRQRLRKSGHVYRRLAEMRVASREYPDDLYDAAEADLAGHDYASATAMFRKYLSVEARKRRPHALLALGEALLSLGQPDEALEALKECIEFHPRDAAVFEARLLASEAHLAAGQKEAAEKLLLDNLDGEALSPASTEWRDSLFALGRLLYESGRYREAIGRLDEATTRYPNAPAIEEARYLAAESYRGSAREVQKQEAQEATAEGRLSRRREREQLLEAGLARYEQELNAILLRQERQPLTTLEEAILRNCFFARGDILFDLGRYQDAIQAYASATNRYQQNPEVLQAYVQIAACYRRLGQTAEARSTLEQAKYALKHLAEGVTFEETSNYNRQEWGQLLETLKTL